MLPVAYVDTPSMTQIECYEIIRSLSKRFRQLSLSHLQANKQTMLNSDSVYTIVLYFL